AAAFKNGEVEYGDIFIGADGGNSKVRENIFGLVNYTPVKVKEVVGISRNPQNAQLYAHKFSKFQKTTNGLAFGFIPTSENELVWFMQFDASISDPANCTPKELRAFCKKLLKKFPSVVSEIIETNDFESTYIWNTRDFDTLPTFHKDNIVLIGDAAHLALPFTSAGTSNAILDAKTLADSLESSNNYNQAFQKYYNLRSEEITSHVNLGRALQKKFLEPKALNGMDIPIPLISTKSQPILEPVEAPVADPSKKPIQVLYFTDPICSTCWIIQPILRKLKLEYGHYLNFEYKMGGLLPNWEDYKKGGINNPADAADHWEKVNISHEMPLDGDIWHEDPLSSSYPPSIAFKAAQMQDATKAMLFLRRIQEMLFLEKKNIIKWDFIKDAASEVGLDTEKLLADFQSNAQNNFTDDLIISGQLGVNSFPTFFFSDGENHIKIKGYQEYEQFEEIIFKLLPEAKKEKINTSPKKLFTHYNSMTVKEFALLSNRPKENAVQVLNSLFDKGVLKKYESKNGVIWKNNFSNYFDMQSSFNKQTNTIATDTAGFAGIECNILKTTNRNESNCAEEVEFKQPLNIPKTEIQEAHSPNKENQNLENEYLNLTALCQSYGEELSKQLSVLFEKEHIKLLFPIQFRPKPWNSIIEKISQGWLANHSSIMGLDDLAGLRIIVMFEKDAERIAELIKENFNIKDSNTTKGEDNNMFGYT
ncbi:MAG: DsbA family protein, partial [Bacteroidetes bacterium]|nr:DsbA family protein [Bacteroidota bacterium]